jgi:hypothetical protein
MIETQTPWSLTELWNGLLTESRPSKPRSYIYASELGQSFLDRLLKMREVTVTNPFEPRTLRVFDCGNIFEIEVMERIFKLLGIFISSQERMVIKTDGLLDVVGKHDPRVGGKINYDEAMERINDPNTSDWMKPRAKAMLEALMIKYPDGLQELITEIKSVNSRSFWAHKNQDEVTGFFKGYPHHKLQLHTYVKHTGIPGRLFYISKDDLTLMETPVQIGDKELEKLWIADVTKMTELYNESQFRPLLQKNENGTVTIADWLREYQEPNILWNEEKQEFEKNWKASWSSYLTLVTGMKDSDEWEASMADELKQANIIPCAVCEKEYTRSTLQKNDGVCGRCVKKEEKDKLEKAELDKDKLDKESKI